MRIEVGDVSFHARAVGPEEGRPVVFVHAFPLGGWMWEPQLGALGGEFRLFAYDVRGFGESGLGDGQHTMETFVDDLLAVLDALRLERPTLCGLSMGGYIALRAAERNPERVGALVLCDTRSAADDDAGRIARAEAIRRVKAEGLAGWTEDFLEGALAPGTPRRDPELVGRLRDRIRTLDPRAVCGALLAMAARTDTTAALARFDVPALVLVGAADALTPPDTARELARRLPRAELRVLPEVGHLSNLENPDAFNDSLAAFLRRLPEGPPPAED